METNTIEIEVGAVKQIVLEDSRASTGSEYMLSQIPGCVFIEGLEYLRPNGEKPGAPGKLIAHLVGAEVGTGVIGFTLTRVWELPSRPQPVLFNLVVSNRRAT